MTKHTPRISHVTGKSCIHHYRSYPSNGDPAYESDDNVTHFAPSYDSRIEYLTDESGSKFARDLSFKYCNHYKMGADVYADVNPPYAIAPSGGGHELVWVEGDLNALWPVSVFGELATPWGTALVPSLRVPLLYATVDDRRLVVDPTDISELIERGLLAALPGIKPNLSLINSIYELKDFRSLPHTIAHVSQQFKALAKRFRRSGRKTLRQLLRANADGYLQAEFNILPLLSDISGIQKTIRNTRKKVSDLISHEGLRQLHHFKVDLSDQYKDSTDHTYYLPNPQADGSFRQTRTIKYNEARFVLTIEYSYELRDFERLNAQLRGLLDGLGVNITPVIIWNAIPWSFVVDWVFSVQSYLRNFTTRNIEPRCNITDCCYSILIDRLTECSIENSIGSQYVAGATATVSRIHEVAFKRQPFAPNMSRSLRVNKLNSHEFSLASALVASRR